jgi:GTP cyclohydrolase II
LVVHISGQDGRGKGTGFKCATQILQKELGYDTVQAARTLAEGTAIDVRTFGGAVAVLKFLLGTQQNVGFVLLSGNPQKVDALTGNGFRVTVKPPEVPATPETIRHLRAKAFHLAHVIPSIAL